MTKYINIFGGPGVGKSTTAALLFAEMKKSGLKAKLITIKLEDTKARKKLYNLMLT